MRIQENRGTGASRHRRTARAKKLILRTENGMRESFFMLIRCLIATGVFFWDREKQKKNAPWHYVSIRGNCQTSQAPSHHHPHAPRKSSADSGQAHVSVRRGGAADFHPAPRGERPSYSEHERRTTPLDRPDRQRSFAISGHRRRVSYGRCQERGIQRCAP